MRNKRYEGFTLVEMLIVMGILIILMVLGIAAGRFALNRANDIAHRNAADQLYQGLQAYHVDHRHFPTAAQCGDGCAPGEMMADADILGQYMDLGAFNGGSPATYIYMVGGDNYDQAVLVCVTMRGLKSVNDGRPDGAYYCNGNGFGVSDWVGDADGNVFTERDIQVAEDDHEDMWTALSENNFQNWSSDWDSLQEGGMGWTDVGQVY